MTSKPSKSISVAAAAPISGPWGPGFKSRAPDQISEFKVLNDGVFKVIRPLYWCSSNVAVGF
jgi:hypothetical protein